MHVLVIADDYWHPAKVARAGLEPLDKGDFEFDWIEDGAAWSAEQMAAYPVVILVKSDNTTAANRDPWITSEVQEAFADYVRQGHGLLAIHSGTVLAKLPVLRGLIGGTFTHHPPQCPVTVEPQQGHLLTTGSEPFTLQDEHYFMELDDPQVDVFMTSTSEHGTQPAGWTRIEGQGRVCVLSPGHNAEVWLHPSFQTLLCNALRWCAGDL